MLPTFQEILQYFAKEWGVFKSAPLAFSILVVVAGFIGYIVSSWYFGGVLATKSALVEQKDVQISRYRVALGIDKASGGALIELTNAEMKAKAATTSVKVRNLLQSLER